MVMIENQTLFILQRSLAFQEYRHWIYPSKSSSCTSNVCHRFFFPSSLFAFDVLPFWLVCFINEIQSYFNEPWITVHNFFFLYLYSSSSFYQSHFNLTQLIKEFLSRNYESISIILLSILDSFNYRMCLKNTRTGGETH